jgi:peptidoglycan-associated lipoprotein
MLSRDVGTLVVLFVVVGAITAACSKRLVSVEVPSAPAVAAQSQTPAAVKERAQPVVPLGKITSRPGWQPGAAAVAAPEAPLASGRPDPTEFVARNDLGDIYFDFDRYEIRPDGARILDANAAWLRVNPSALVLIEGHCDERGTDAYNLALGDRRARSAMNYLVSRGIRAVRITILSYGEERPVCREHNEACWTKNRRARFLVRAG